jgi:integrase
VLLKEREVSDVQFSLYKRPRKNKKPVFYARFRKPDGTWSSGRSTGQTSEGAAQNWALQQLENGKAKAFTSGCPTLKQWTNGFWGAGGQYHREREARGYSISHVYLENSRRSLEKYILPVFGNRRLYELDPATLDAFFLNLYEESGLSGSTVNSIMKSLRTPLKKAVRLGYINRSPMEGVQQMNPKGLERGALTQDELNLLFDPRNVELTWNDRRREMVMCMLAAGCGLRWGEAAAVRPMDTDGGILRVTRQWDRNGASFKPPKHNSVREVPVPPRLQDELHKLQEELSIPDDGVYTAGVVATRPYARLDTSTPLRNALEAIGIPKENQKRTARFLDFHALRHTYITRLREEGVPDWQIMSAAGHKSVDMTNRYTHGRAERFEAIAGTRIIPFAM